MRAYIIRRLLLMIPTLFIVTIVTFLSVRFIPGDAVDAMAVELEMLGFVTDREALAKQLGLDVPFYVQYGRWMGGILLHGTLGEPLWGGDVSIEEKILARLPVTIELGVLAILIGLVIAVPVGIYSAMRRNSAADYVGRAAAVIGLATPNFWLALMVIIYPALWWGWSPPMRLVAFTEDPLGNLGVFIIPSLILGTALSAGTMRLTRTMNALIPVVTLLCSCLSCSVIMENIFNLPGLGRLMVLALLGKLVLRLSHQDAGGPG